MTLESLIHTMIFKKMSCRNDGHDMGNNTPSFASMFLVLWMNFIVLCDEHCCIYVAFDVMDLMNYVIIWCSGLMKLLLCCFGLN